MKKITEKQLKRMYSKLAKKGKFAIAAGEKLGKSPFTIRSHWFSDNDLTGNMPQDQETLKILYDELKKAPKKQNKKS